MTSGNTVQEFIACAKAYPGELTFGLYAPARPPATNERPQVPTPAKREHK